MEKLNDFEKKQFIIQECMLMSYQAGVQTRNKHYPVYNKLPEAFTNLREIRFQPDNTSNLKTTVFDFLSTYLSEIQENGVNEEDHFFKIASLADSLSNEFKPVLKEGRFRIGISQKIINLFLKYMWSMGEIPEPCHCPMDGIVKSQIQKRLIKLPLVDWTQLDNMTDYLTYVLAVKELAEKDNMTIATWEFLNWGRR